MSLRLRIIREPSRFGATLGVLFANGRFQCFTCEDEIREVPGRPVGEWKIYGKTAIPAGEYRIIVTMSQRFERRLPLLLDVPGFTGIRMHPGNTPRDTAGCILPGIMRTDAGVGGSRQAFNPLFQLIELNPPVIITIENPLEYPSES